MSGCNITEGEEAAEDEVAPQVKTRKGWSRFYITIEPIKIAIGFTNALTSGVTIDILQRNICQLNYNLTLEHCTSNVSTNVKASVESLTAEMNMLNQVLQALFPLLLVVFIGPWSDINGRKPFILCPLLSLSVYYLCWTLMSLFPNIPVLYLLIPSVPLGLSGGIIAISVCTWSYTCDNFEVDGRPMRFSFIISLQVAGRLLGNILSSQAVHLAGDLGYQIIFSISFIVTLMMFFYTLLIVEETVVRQQDSAWTKLFDFENVKNLFLVVIIRPEKGRILSALILTVLLMEIPFNAGDTAIIYLVGKTQYFWTLNDYNTISAISSVVSALSPIFFVWLFMKVCGTSNITVIIIGCTIFVISEVMTALSVNQTMFWLSSLAVKAGGVVGPTIDTELSNVVSKCDMGKAFTIISICTALSSLTSVPLYTLAYKLFLPNHTQYVFFISAVLATVALIASVSLYFKKSSISYIRQYNSEDST